MNTIPTTGIIWNYDIKRQDIQTFEFPRSATILTVKSKAHGATMYVQMDPCAPKVKREFYVYPDNRRFNPQWLVYVATIENADRTFHLYENINTVK